MAHVPVVDRLMAQSSIFGIEDWMRLSDRDVERIRALLHKPEPIEETHDRYEPDPLTDRDRRSSHPI